MTDTAAPAVALAVGQEVEFKAYAELQPGQEEIFKPGDRVRITDLGTADSGMTIVSTTDPDKTDTAFADKITVIAADAPAAEKPKRARTGKAQPTAPAAATPAAAPAAKAPTVKGGAAASKKADADKAKAEKEAAKKEAADKKAADKAAKDKAKADAKAAKVPQVKEPAPVEELVQTDTLAAVLESNDAMAAARSLIDQTEETFFTLGGVLAFIYQGNLYQAAGYDGKQGWQTYLKAELNLEYRKAQYLMNIYKAFTALDIDEKRLSKVSWSKVRELVSVVTKENVEDLLDFAENHTRDEIIAHISVTYPEAKRGGDGSAQPTERAKRTTYKFGLFEQNAEVVNQALDAAKGKFDTASLDDAFFGIVSEWSQLSGAVETTLEAELARLNTKFGLNITVEDAQSTAGEGTGE